MFATGRYQNHNQFLTREAQATFLEERYRGQDLLDHQLTHPFDAIEVSHQPYPYGAAFQPPSGGYEANPYVDQSPLKLTSAQRRLLPGPQGGEGNDAGGVNWLLVIGVAAVAYYMLVPR